MIKNALVTAIFLLSAFAQKTTKDDLYRKGTDATMAGDAMGARDAFCEITKSDPEYKDAKAQCATYTNAAERVLARYKMHYEDGMAAMQRGDYDLAELKLRNVKAGEYAASAKQKLTELQTLKREKAETDRTTREASASAALSNHTKWLETVMRTLDTIKPGSSRAELMTVFAEQGGLSTRTHRTYVYKSCPYIAVDVDFVPYIDPEKNVTESPRDKIAKISRPYLAYPVYG